MKRIFDGEKMVAIDGEYEFELGFCYRQIKAWKQWNFRKNSKYPAEIYLRLVHHIPVPDFWLGYLELSVNSKIKEQIRICAEAYEVLERDMPRSDDGKVEFVTLASFNPQNDP